MRSACFEICLIVWPYQELSLKIRSILRPLRSLHHRMLDAVEGLYSEEQDAAVLRLSFAPIVTHDRGLQGHLVELIGSLGLDLVLPGELSERKRQGFQAELARHFRMRVQRYPSASSPWVLPPILDALDLHLVERVQTLPAPVQRPPTIEAMDLLIAELPHRSETVEALDGLIAELPHRSETVEALDGLIAELDSRPENPRAESTSARLTPGSRAVMQAIASELQERAPTTDSHLSLAL